MNTICIVSNCEHPAFCKYFCTGHYQRVAKYGNPLSDRPLRQYASTAERLMTHVAKSPQTGCWLWIGKLNANGYGATRNALGKNTLAHRVSYETFRDIIPDGMEIDHICRIRRCINPDHLEAVTHRVNIQRGDTAKHMWKAIEASARKRRENPLCRNGHSRILGLPCPICMRAKCRRRNARKKLTQKAKLMATAQPQFQT